MTNTNFENEQSEKNSKHIIMFGTGDFAQALGWRLSKGGYKITFVSRNPEGSK